jgi:hypothetical protein
MTIVKTHFDGKNFSGRRLGAKNFDRIRFDERKRNGIRFDATRLEESGLLVITNQAFWV